MDAEIRRCQLDLLIKELAGGKKAEFARLLNISSSRFQMWFQRGHIDVEMVAEVFPKVSAEWLLRNTGTMFKDGPISADEQDLYDITAPLLEENVSLAEYDELKTKYEKLREVCIMLKEEKNALFDKLMQHL